MLVEKEDCGSWRRRKRRGSSWRRRGRRGEGKDGGVEGATNCVSRHRQPPLSGQCSPTDSNPGRRLQVSRERGRESHLAFWVSLSYDPSVSERGPKPQPRKPFRYRGTPVKKAFAEVCVAKKKLVGVCNDIEKHCLRVALDIIK